MESFIKEIETGSNVKKIVQSGQKLELQLFDDTGTGNMTVYEVFSGIYLIHSDMHLSSCLSQFQLKGDVPMLCIDHCREGRMEMELQNNLKNVLQEHELRIDDRKNQWITDIFIKAR